MLTLTRMNKTRTGYTKRDERELSASPAGADELNLLIQDFKQATRPAKAWNFSVFEDGEMSGATWTKSTALVLDYAATSNLAASIAQVSTAMDRTQLGHFLINGEDRYGAQTIAVVIPLTEHVSRERYARLVYVLLEELKATGLALYLVKGTSAMSHQIHPCLISEAVWHPGPALNPTAKIRATKNAAQNMDRDRFTVGARAAEVQLDRPLLTACDDDLFQW